VIYELRIYTAMPGRMGDLLARFREHTCRLFEKHGITNVGYWLNDAGGRNDELWYVLAYPDAGARGRSWAAFAADPEWLEAYAASEADGPLMHHFENRLLRPVDFSPLS
jgi:hypothetical protein